MVPLTLFLCSLAPGTTATSDVSRGYSVLCGHFRIICSRETLFATVFVAFWVLVAVMPKNPAEPALPG